MNSDGAWDEGGVERLSDQDVLAFDTSGKGVWRSTTHLSMFAAVSSMPQNASSAEGTTTPNALIACLALGALIGCFTCFVMDVKRRPPRGGSLEMVYADSGKVRTIKFAIYKNATGVNTSEGDPGSSLFVTSTGDAETKTLVVWDVNPDSARTAQLRHPRSPRNESISPSSVQPITGPWQDEVPADDGMPKEIARHTVQTTEFFYSVWESVDYFSKSHGKWLSARVAAIESVESEDGLPLFAIHISGLGRRGHQERACVPLERLRRPFKVCGLVDYWSPDKQTWMPATIDENQPAGVRVVGYHLLTEDPEVESENGNRLRFMPSSSLKPRFSIGVPVKAYVEKQWRKGVVVQGGISEESWYDDEAGWGKVHVRLDDGELLHIFSYLLRCNFIRL